jgi:hypothetical protein
MEAAPPRIFVLIELAMLDASKAAGKLGVFQPGGSDTIEKYTPISSTRCKKAQEAVF